MEFKSLYRIIALMETSLFRPDLTNTSQEKEAQPISGDGSTHCRRCCGFDNGQSN